MNSPPLPFTQAQATVKPAETRHAHPPYITSAYSEASTAPTPTQHNLNLQ